MNARPGPDFVAAVSMELEKLLSGELRRLFEEKHLYQTLKITPGDELLLRAISLLEPAILPAMIEPAAGARPSGPRHSDPSTVLLAARRLAEGILCTWPWGLLEIGGMQEPTMAARTGERGLSFRVDTIMTYCSRCSGVYPFNFVRLQDVFASHPKEKGGLGPTGLYEQVFAFTFQCQTCKGFPEVFLVHRIGAKVILSGRAPIEEVRVPPFIPKASRAHYSDAIVAAQCSKTLAGLFYLRVLIEQFAYSVPDTAKLLADQAIDRYMESLPDDFKRHFPSLGDVYGKLSEALHKANPDEALFRESLGNIERHFDARRVHELPDWGT